MNSKVQFFLPVLLLLLSAYSTIAQTEPTNSFKEIYKKTNSKLNYKYDSDNQIHDYSNNWDLDNDGINDGVFFVGTGGAHLYYFLRIVLSSDKAVRDFPYLQSDFPFFAMDEWLTETDFNSINNQVQLAVIDFEKDSTNDIYIELDNSTIQAYHKILKRKRIKTNYVVLTFKKGKAILKDFKK